MIIVLVTVPQGKGREISEYVLKKHLAACVNISTIDSMYWDNGGLAEVKEELLIIKTREDLYDRLEQEIRKIHPYNIPEIVAINVEEVNVDYLRWLESETSIKKIKESENS